MAERRAPGYGATPEFCTDPLAKAGQEASNEIGPERRKGGRKVALKVTRGFYASGVDARSGISSARRHQDPADPALGVGETPVPTLRHTQDTNRMEGQCLSICSR